MFKEDRDKWTKEFQTTTAIQQKSGWEKLKEALAREGNFVKDSPKHEHHFKRLSLLNNEERHAVWKPKYKFSDIVTLAENMKKKQIEHAIPSKTEKCAAPAQVEFKLRQKTLMNRVHFAWKVLQEESSTPVVSVKETESSSDRWKEAAKKVIHTSEKKQTDFSITVANLLAEK